MIKHKKNLNIFLVKIDESKELGRGGFGTVFLGTFEGNNVAVKKIPVSVLDEEICKEDLQRKIELQREVELHKQLDHRNVLKLLHVDDEKDPKWK